MKLLFVALTKHQYRYFKRLQKELFVDAKVLFLPTWKLSLKGFLKSFTLDTQTIEMFKYKEVDAKYHNPLKKMLYKTFLKLQIPFIYSALYHAIKHYDPDFVVFWNGKKFHQAIGVKVAERMGKKKIFFENGFLPHTTQMDFHGVNASNTVPRDLSFYQSLTFDEDCSLPEVLQQRASYKKREDFTKPLPPHYIFVPFQVAYDTQIIQHGGWVNDMHALFDLVVQMAELTGLCFVIKEHPSDRVSNYEDLHKRASEKIIFSHQNTQLLIENADAILTVNSSVGIEGLLFAKRVIVLGEAFFAIDGIVKKAEDKARLLEILTDIQHWKVDTETSEKFLKYLQCSYLIPNSWREPKREHLEAIQKRLRKELDHV